MAKIVKRVATLAAQGTASPITAANRLLGLGIGGLPNLPPIANELIPDPDATPASPDLPPPPAPVLAGATPLSPVAGRRRGPAGPTPEQRARRAATRLRAGGGQRRRQTLLTGALGIPASGEQLTTRLGS